MYSSFKSWGNQVVLDHQLVVPDSSKIYVLWRVISAGKFPSLVGFESK